MSRKTRASIAGIAVSLVVAAGVAWAGSQGGATAFGAPVFALCAGLAFAINWIAFVPAYLAGTERFYDLTGSLTYLALVVAALLLAGAPDLRAVVLAVLVALWAVRLGSFLFRRISRDGGDGRFDAIKVDALRFLMTWTLQALWVCVTLSCALAAMTAERGAPLGVAFHLGLVLWVAGFAIEVMADRQKSAFRARPENRGRFIDVGLWSWSRHPNYFGEIVLWTGVAVMALPALTGWQHLTLISPVFVWVLLTRISGVPMLEARGRKRWGDDPAYRRYVEQTPVLLPRPPRSAGPAASS